MVRPVFWAGRSAVVRLVALVGAGLLATGSARADAPVPPAAALPVALLLEDLSAGAGPRPSSALLERLTRGMERGGLVRSVLEKTGSGDVLSPGSEQRATGAVTSTSAQMLNQGFS